MNCFIGYPKCSTCISAKKILTEYGFAFEERDIKEDRLNEEELRQLIAQSGLSSKQFFNTSGMKYRELGLKDKLPTMSEDEKIALLASDGMLVKRPIFVCHDQIVVGKKEKAYMQLKEEGLTE